VAVVRTIDRAAARVAGDHLAAAAGDATTPPAGSSLAGSPVRVRIPAIGVRADMDQLGLNADGTLSVPPYDRAGWYGGGPKPGETGPAVIAAHVDSETGPAVFHKLSLLRPGDAVTVDYDDGTSVEFVVRGADRYLKSEFPTERVYGVTEIPELRLITCGGSFDRRARSYTENLVVTATVTSARAD
jgi:sortase (surface protein transpeptidase)